MAAAEDIAIANKALALTGANAITDFTDTSTEGVFINTIYEDLAEAVLGSARWSFAKRQTTLTRNGTAPTANWEAKYDIPATKPLITHRILSDGYPVTDYEEFADGYYMNEASTATIVLVEGFRQTTANWPALFSQGFMLSVASYCAVGLAENEAKMKMYSELADNTLARARKVYAQGHTNRKFDTSAFINARRT